MEKDFKKRNQRRDLHLYHVAKWNTKISSVEKNVHFSQWYQKNPYNIRFHQPNTDFIKQPVHK